MTEPERRLPDGRLRVRRTFIGPNGEIGEGMTTIGPDDPGYDEWAGWIRPPRDPLVTRTSAAPTSPAPMPAHSAHFEDFRPVETSAPKPNYPQPLTGPGRWFTMRDTDGSLFGVLFTDDRLSLGLIATQDSSPGQDRRAHPPRPLPGRRARPRATRPRADRRPHTGSRGRRLLESGSPGVAEPQRLTIRAIGNSARHGYLPH